ncbi:unnamed protein product [Linum tenue]|uniref:ubiquitinyl hydrolase 1 n=1 Tax=Linum tenue TaxID=586396 RepID=A0AAV0JAN4_9ROSI|nr:unnamed protein product [Linum tenue]
MHVPGDLGFSSLVLAAVCLAFPVVTLLIHRKWRLAVARNEEINRLLVLASEEAVRAELEATVSYSPVPVSRNVYQCFVCYSPTTTRCAQCKAVRYCSGKCQIIHWRQGHRDECRPPPILNDDITSFKVEVAEQIEPHTYDARWENAPSDTSSTEHASSDSGSSPDVAHRREEDTRVDFISDAMGVDSTSESSGTFFSGFSSPATSRESSDEASVSESISSNDHESPDRQTTTDCAPGILCSGLSKGDRPEALSPKFAKLADATDNVKNMVNSDGIKLYGEKPSNFYVSSSSSSPSINATFSKTNPVKIASDYWCGASESVVATAVEDDSAKSSSARAVKTKVSDSDKNRHFKYNMGRTDALSSNKQRPEGKKLISDEEPSRNSVLENITVDAPRISSAKSGNSERYTRIRNDSCVDSKVLIAHEPRATSISSAPLVSSNCEAMYGDALKVSLSSSSNSKRSNLVASDTMTASLLSKPRLSSSGPEHHPSSMCGHSLPNGRDVKVENGEVFPVTSNQSGSMSSNSMSGLKSSMRKVVDHLRGPKFGRYSNKGIFPYDLFVKLYSHKVDLQPSGLINCGNSCYANAVLQCLSFTPPLMAYFAQGHHSKGCARKEWCFTCELENLVLKAKEGRSPLSPISILSQLQNIGSNLGNGREEDAHEFLRYAIDAMQSVCLKEAGIKADGSTEEETTLIGLTFGGYLRSKIKCMKCHYKSERQERMMDLTVEIEGDISKLEDALRRFTSTEILDGENKYQCGRCKSYEKAKKKLTILKAPNILTIALKRFQSGKFGKLNKSIRFPEILDLAPYMSGTSDKSPVYRLYAVIVHLDIMNASFSGHYVCYVKNSQNRWYKIDDSAVTTVELERVLTKGAYMLLYARCSPQAPPGLIKNGTVLSPDVKNNKGSSASKIHSKVGLISSRSSGDHESLQHQPNSVVSDPDHEAASVESFYLKFHRLQRILEEDSSSSDNYSFTSSSNSDEGSCSTDSTRDSTSADDLSDYIFGGWNSSTWRKAAADFDTTTTSSSSSSSSSPLYSRHSPLSNMERDTSAARFADTSGSHDRFYHADTVEHNNHRGRKLGSSSCREADSERLVGWVSNKLSSLSSNDAKSGVHIRRSVSERTD